MLARAASQAFRPALRRLPATSRFASTFFTSQHEFARVDGGVATCGITDFAQTQLGDVVYVSLPKKGDTVKKGVAMATVESVKAASDVYAPVSGTVTEVNSALTDSPALVNESAEDKAWFVKIKLSDAAETGTLLSADAYKAHCDAEKH